LAALVADDLDCAIELGLLTNSGCAGCSDVCSQTMTATREARLRALAARERFRARETRLQRRADDRANKRITHPETTVSNAAEAKPALPSAAAAALARAKAKAAERGSR